MMVVDHATFVGTTTGCNQRELFLLQLVVFLSLMLRNVSIPWVFLGRNFTSSATWYWIKFLLDFIFLVVPGILGMTIFNSSLSLISLILAACLLTLLLFVFCEYLISADRPPARLVLNKIIDDHHSPTTFLTYYRACMLLLVGTAILAVDFPVFPRRFAKTEKYGHSLMDIGVAGFVYASALGGRLKTTSMRDGKDIRKAKNKYWWIQSSSVILPIAGAARTVILYILDYPQHVSEYGVHWNFFYTMAVIHIVSKILPQKFPLITAIIFGAAQQLLLTVYGYEDWILNGENTRENLLTANIEGICSLPGYLCLYYLASALASFISTTGIRVRSWLECCLRLFLLSGVFFAAQSISEWTLGPPSRRVLNVTYVFAQMSLLTFALACFLAVQMFTVIAWAARVPHFSVEDNPWSGVDSCLSKSVNRAGLFFFLLCNLFTGAVNLSIDAHSTDDVTALCVLFGYMLLTCLPVHYKAYCKLKLK